MRWMDVLTEGLDTGFILSHLHSFRGNMNRSNSVGSIYKTVPTTNMKQKKGAVYYTYTLYVQISHLVMIP